MKLDTKLRDYEADLDFCAKDYGQKLQKQAKITGWIKPHDYCFTGKGTKSWRRQHDRASFGGDQETGCVVVPVPLPIRPPKKLFSSDSGQISASALRYRRLRTYYIRGLYLQLIIRNHWTEEGGEGQCAGDAEAKVAGKKRKRGSNVGTGEGDDASFSGTAGEESEGVKGGRSEKTKEEKRR